MSNTPILDFVKKYADEKNVRLHMPGHKGKIRDSGEKSVLFYWMYAIAFMLHIYFDFSGYSDMAIGLGKIFGFQFCI